MSGQSNPSRRVSLAGFSGQAFFARRLIRRPFEHKIRRLIKAIADQPDHTDRSQIEPTALDVDVERLAAQ